MKRKLFLILMVSLLSVSSHAEELPEWFYKAIKVETPNQLSYLVSSGTECPFTTESLSKIVDGVLVRSRIKPLEEDFFVDNRIYLNAYVNCSQLSLDRAAFNIEINFARYYPLPAITINQGFDAVGTGGQEFIKQAFKEKIEDAVTAHIKANFDL